MTQEKATITRNKRPLNIAHRGAADLWPENTLAAFARAIEAGVDGIEFDIQLCADSVLMVHHDAQLKPEATRLNGAFLQKPTPRIDALTYTDLKAYEVGHLDPDSDYGRRRSGRQNIDACAIPTLAELDDLVAQTAAADFRAYCELKTDMGPDPTQAHQLADAYLAALKTSPIADAHIAISFDWRCLERVRAARPDMAHAYTTLSFASTDPTHETKTQDTPLGAAIRNASANGAPWFGSVDWRDMPGDTHAAKVLQSIKAAGGQGWFGEQSDMTAQNIALAKKLGLRVSAWTVNQPDAMRALIDANIDAIITDRPDVMKQLS